jgi:hypothetical protein
MNPRITPVPSSGATGQAQINADKNQTQNILLKLTPSADEKRIGYER